MQDYHSTLRLHAGPMDNPRTHLVDTSRHDRRRRTNGQKAEGSWGEVATPTYQHLATRQAPGRYARVPGTRFATYGASGRTPVGRRKGWKYGQSSGMRMIRYCVRYGVLSVGIAVLWYGIRVGRAWWEMP